MKLDILSTRNNEVEKLNEAFDIVFPYSKIGEDRLQSMTSKANNENSASSGKKRNYNYNYSENTE